MLPIINQMIVDEGPREVTDLVNSILKWDKKLPHELLKIEYYDLYFIAGGNMGPIPLKDVAKEIEDWFDDDERGGRPLNIIIKYLKECPEHGEALGMVLGSMETWTKAQRAIIRPTITKTIKRAIAMGVDH